MRTMAALVACLTIASGAAAEPPASTPLAADAVIFDGSQVPAMLSQCSRDTPAAGEGTWQPEAADISAFEDALPAALAARYRGPQDLSAVPNGWRRQYVGIVRSGKRYVYGNFFPIMTVGSLQAGSDRWRQGPVYVCDGGAGFFGAEYDVEARRFTHLAFNGIA